LPLPHCTGSGWAATASGFVPAGGVLRRRANAGTIEAAGLELTAEHRFGDALSLDAALSVTDAEIDGGTAAPQLTGLKPAQAPVWSASAGAEWRATERLTLVARGAVGSHDLERFHATMMKDRAGAVKLRPAAGV
jgi:outer membrane receptor protein involved in Fe transport